MQPLKRTLCDLQARILRDIFGILTLDGVGAAARLTFVDSALVVDPAIS
jgi:hypothetical protein